MNEGKFTPGEWCLDGNSIRAENGALVGCAWQTDKPGEEADANARLIAKAPELLEMLEECVGHFRFMELDHACGPLPDEDLKKAEALIAEAKGEPL